MVLLKNSLTVLATTIFLLNMSTAKAADILFEGYSKILSGGVHIGYIINRYEFDNKKKQFISTSFLKIQDVNGGITESLKAYASEDLKPISYSYTTLVGATTKIIDAKAEGNKLVATIKEGGKPKKSVLDLPKGSFLSTFLVYVILKSPQGLKPETKYEYQAIAEEDAKIEKGIAVIKNPEAYNGVSAFRVLNDFKGQKFISYITDRGEVLNTKSPVQSIATELVANPAEALGKFQISQALLTALFGAVPEGKYNEIARQANAVNAGAKQSDKPAAKPTVKPPVKPPPGFAPGPGKGFIDQSQPAEPLESGTQKSKDR
jgi:hypothetical protein